MAFEIFISLRNCFAGTCITRVQNDIKISDLIVINKETIFEPRGRTQVKNKSVGNCISRKVSIIKCFKTER